MRISLSKLHLHRNMEAHVSNLNCSAFGSWNLSECVLNALRNEASQCQVDLTLDIKFLNLISKVEDLEKVQYKNKLLEEESLDCLNDIIFPQEPDVSPSTIYNFPGSSIKIKEVPLDAAALTSKLIDCVKGDAGVQEIIHIISNVGVNSLQNSLIEVWNRLKLPEEKQKFIKLLSAYQSCLGVVCRNVLLPELKKEDSFYSVMEIIVPVLECLQLYVAPDLLLPLLSDEDSLLNRETGCFKEIMTSLSYSQKCELITCFITLMEESLNKNHLQVFAGILEEATLKENEIPRLVSVLNSSIDKFKDDRYLGKILMTIVDSYSSTSSKVINKELSQLCNNFKGVMRFRINAALKKCTS